MQESVTKGLLSAVLARRVDRIVKAAIILAALTSVLALSACATLAGHPLTYSAEPIEGWVVDAANKQPLDGVIVTANWELSNAFGAAVGQMMVMETVTDANGRFYFPAWGPKLRPPNSIIKDQDPQLVLFKSGYDFARLQNPVGPLNKASVRKSAWNGKTIALKPFEDHLIKRNERVNTSAYARRLAFIKSSLSWAYSRDICELKRIPRMAIALHLQEQEFKERGIYSTLPSIDYIFKDDFPDRCGLQKALRSYLP